MQIIHQITFPYPVMHSIGTFFIYLDRFAIDCHDLFVKEFEYGLQYFGR